MKIGIAIKKIRKDLGISQKDFAETLGISQIYLSQIEHGQKSPNFKNVIERVSEIINVPLPVVLFLSVEESDIRDDKKELYKMFKPTLDKIIKDIFFTTTEKERNE